MKNPTGEEKDSIKAELMTSSTTKTLNGYVVKRNIAASSSSCNLRAISIAFQEIMDTLVNLNSLLQ